jgi:hypothetical protein
MDAKGYEAITQVFIDEKLTALVLPYPYPGQHSEHVTIQLDVGEPGIEKTAPAFVLNALGEAGLYDAQGNGDKPQKGPYLKLLLGDSAGITFLDMNNGK